MEDLFIYGAGGAGEELACALIGNPKWRVCGFIDDTMTVGKILHGISVVGGMSFLKGWLNPINVAMCIVGNPHIKQKLIEEIKSETNIVFPTIINHNSFIHPDVEMGEGCIVSLPFNWISPSVKFGNFVFQNCSTRVGHDVVVGDYTTIYSNIDISGHVEIGSHCVIGTGVVIKPKVKLGNNVIIGSGASVVKDVPDNVVVAGNPAKMLKYNVM